MTMESGIRKLIVLEETILNEGGGSAVRPVCRVAGVGVFTNPCSGRFVSDVAMHDLEVRAFSGCVRGCRRERRASCNGW